MVMKMITIFLLGVSLIFWYCVPSAESGFGVVTQEMRGPYNIDILRGVDFKGNPVKLPGSVPSEELLKITAEEVDTYGPLQEENVAEANRREILESLLNRPRALLYTEANFTGLEEKYEYRDHPTEGDYRGSCINTEHLKWAYLFTGHLMPGWMSVKTFGSCVRLFRQFDCRWGSIAVYPGTSAELVYMEIEGEVFYPRSVGPCLEHEFKFASVSKVNGELVVKKDESNYLQIPDKLIARMQHAQFEMENLSSTLTTVTQLVQERGPKYNRTKHILVTFNLNGVYYLTRNPGEDIILDKKIKWRPFLQEKKDGDDLGYVIPPKLGGPTDEMYNIFPQGKDNHREWAAVTDIIFESFRSRGGHTPQTKTEFLSVTLFYENEETTRPFGLYYYVSMLMAYEGNRIDYGFLYN